MIIDFRVRPPFKSFCNLNIYGPRESNPDPVTAPGVWLDLAPCRSFDDRSIERFVEEMDEAGIDVAVAMGRNSPAPWGSVANSDVAELVDTYPGRFVGFGSVDGSSEDRVRQVDECAELGFKGVAMDNPWCSPALYDDDESLFPVYERVAEHGLILSLTSSIYLGPDMSYCMPMHIQRVAMMFPQVPIVVPHAFWPWTTQGCGVAFQNSNVYLAPDFYGHIPNSPGAEEYVKAANYYLGYRLLFASSYPIRPLGQSVEQFVALPFKDDDLRQRCLGGNARRLLGI